MSRGLLTAILAVAWVIASGSYAIAQFGNTDTGFFSPEKTTTVKSSKSNTSDRTGPPRGLISTRATTVKSSKSNTSDRVGQTSDWDFGPAFSTTVKSNKSNTSDRMGGGGGAKGAGSVAKTTTVKSSKSNTSD